MIPKLNTAIYTMKKMLGRPVILIGITNTSYDRQNRTGTVSYSRVRLLKGIINPVNQTLTAMVGKQGSVNKSTGYVIIDMRDIPKTFDFERVTYIQFDGITYNVTNFEIIETNKAIIYTLTGINKDYRFIVEGSISQNCITSDNTIGINL